MYYKRNEPFRYTVGQPVTAMIETLKKEQQTLILLFLKEKDKP